MGDSKDIEAQPKRWHNPLKSKIVQNTTLGLGLIGLPIGFGHATAKPKEDFQAVTQGVHRGLDAAGDTYNDPRGTTAEILIKIAEKIDAEKVKNTKTGVQIEPRMDLRDLFFAGSSDEEKVGMQQKLDAEREVLIGNPDKGLPGALDVQSFETISEVMPILDDIEKVAGVPKEVLIGLIFTESQGRRDAVSPSGAVDLVQFMPPMLKKYNIEPRDLSRRDDKEYNAKKDREFLTATAQELSEAFKRWNGDGPNKDWGLALSEYHMGASNVYLVLQKYAQVEGIVNMEVPQNVEVGDTPELQATATVVAGSLITDWQKVIDGNKINFYKLTANKEVADMLSGSEFNDTLRYVPRVEQGGQIWDDMVMLVQKSYPATNP